jgi:hypothetical protein
MKAEAGAGMEWSTTGSSGAILFLPEGGSSTRYSGEKDLTSYIEQHCQNWFPWVAKVTRGDHSTLTVITGVHHAKSWALASHSTSSTSVGSSIKLNIGNLVGVDGGFDLSWDGNAPWNGRVCAPRQCHRKARQNQAVFITAVHVQDRSRTLWELVKRFVRNNQPALSALVDELRPDEPQLYHPARVIIKYVSKNVGICLLFI